jgi:hypothetical protein
LDVNNKVKELQVEIRNLPLRPPFYPNPAKLEISALTKLFLAKKHENNF